MLLGPERINSASKTVARVGGDCRSSTWEKNLSSIRDGTPAASDKAVIDLLLGPRFS
jgi:hypothetical protein